MEAEIKNDQELYSYFRGRTATLCRDNFTFLMDHPEVKRVLNDYLSNILLHKPDDVFKFTKDYFKFLSDKGESVKFVVLVGPNSVGKSTLIDRVMKEYPNVFERPKFTSSKEKENCIVVSKEDFMDMLNKKEVLSYTYDNKEKEYEGITKGEIQRIINEGKVALLEIDLTGALKINSSSIDANFVGILPPSIDALRKRVKEHTKLNTGNINKVLEKAAEEVKEIEAHSFFSFRIINDEIETGYKDFKNAMNSLFPFLKYSPEDIEKVKEIASKGHEEKKEENEEGMKEIKEEEKKDDNIQKEVSNEEEKKDEVPNEEEKKEEAPKEEEKKVDDKPIEEEKKEETNSKEKDIPKEEVKVEEVKE